MKEISKNFYIKSIIWCGVAGVLFSMLTLFLAQALFTELTVLCFIIASCLLIYSFSAGMVLTYKMWKYIQDAHSRTTPLKAVGFLQIPLFNIYWIFQVYWGWAKDFNALIGRNRYDIEIINEKLFLTFCVLNIIATFFPILYIVNALLLWHLIGKAIDGCNSLVKFSSVL